MMANPIRDAIQAALSKDVMVPDRDLGKYVDREKVKDVALARQIAQHRAKGRAVHKIKAQAVKAQFDNHPGKNLNGVLNLAHRGKSVTISKVEVVDFGDGNSCVEIWTGGTTGPPQYRVFNPPTLAEDSRGDIELDRGNGRRQKFREDPVMALVEVLAGGDGR